MNALRIKNTSESDPRSYEVSSAVTNKAQKKYRSPLEPQIFFLGFICNCLS